MARTAALLPGDSRGLVGRRLDGYRLDCLLGRGGIGVVYLAEQVALRRPVALKVLSGAHAANPEHVTRFVREAHAAARLVHPNAVQVYDIGEAAGHHYIALEYIDGGDLAELLEWRGRLTVRAALEVVRQAALPLARAHEMGIVHRDIKPANLLLSRRGEVKLTDFGLALLDDAPSITLHDAILGTPDYMSPEQARGRRAGPAADLYSLGAVLYHTLTGRPPFHGYDVLDVIGKHATEKPVAPLELAPDLPEAVSRLTMKLLSKKPQDRPASAGDLIEEITQARSGAVTNDRVVPSNGREPLSPGEKPREEEPRAWGQVYTPAGLSREEMRELLAYEATYACLVPRPRRAFLEATMRNYRIPKEKMLPFLDRKLFTEQVVWDLQVLKRSARKDRSALEIIRSLRRTRTRLNGKRVSP